MKRKIDYIIIFCIMLSIFLVNINASSHQIIDIDLELEISEGTYAPCPLTDVDPPHIAFIPPTPENGIQNSDTIPIYIESSDENSHYTLLDFNQSLLLWMHMDHVNGTGENSTVYDNSTHQNHGLTKGDARQTEEGAFGKGFYFDNDQDYITTGKQLIYNNSMTFGGWVKWDTVGEGDSRYDVPIQQADFEDYGYEIYSYDGYQGKYYVIGYHWTRDGGKETDEYEIQTGIWYHTILRHNATHLSLYINGEHQSSYPDNFSVVPAEFCIGGGGPQDAYWHDGRVDEVVVYNRALSSSEIAALYDASKHQFHTNITGLAVGNYSYTGYAVDAAGNKNQTEPRWRNIKDFLNDPPTPPILTGPSIELTGQEIEFSITSSDPDGDPIYFFINWGDGQSLEYGPYASDENITISHEWENEGQYTISAQARDIYYPYGLKNIHNLVLFEKDIKIIYPQIGQLCLWGNTKPLPILEKLKRGVLVGTDFTVKTDLSVLITGVNFTLKFRNGTIVDSYNDTGYPFEAYFDVPTYFGYNISAVAYYKKTRVFQDSLKPIIYVQF